MTSNRKPIQLALALPDFLPDQTLDAVGRVNSQIRQILAANFKTTEMEQASLIVYGALLDTRPFTGPPRLIFCHGALGDPAHWAE